MPAILPTSLALRLAGLALCFLVLVWLSGLALRGIQIDLTEAREHTLSPATVGLLQGLDEPVTLRLFFSATAAADFPAIKAYARRTQDLLLAMAERSEGRLRIEFIDPEPFSEDEDRAVGHGLTAIPLPAGGQFFFGIVGIDSTDGELPIAFLDPAREPFLEYNLARLIAALGHDDRPVLALYSGLPMAPAFDPVLGAPSPGWVIDQQLRELFDLRRLQPGFVDIPAEVDLLVLVHPRELPEDSLHAIDQFALRGGRVLAFLDPDAEQQPTEDPFGGAVPGSRRSNLEPLLSAWGLEFSADRIAADPAFAQPVKTHEGGPEQPLVTLLGLDSRGLSATDIVTAGLERVNLSSAGVLRPRPGASTRFEPLLSTTAGGGEFDAAVLGTVNAMPVQLLQDFRPEGIRVLAARLSGPVASAFPERAGQGRLQYSTTDLNAIVVADSDLLADAFWVHAPRGPGGFAEPFANNADFVYNAVENLSGDPGLIALRTRSVASRPFHAVEALRRNAEQQFLAKEQELRRQLGDLDRQLRALQQGAEATGSPALGPAQQRELLGFQQQKAELRIRLRQVQHQLMADIERLEARLKLINIVLVPALVAAAFLLLGLWRLRRRRAAG